ncbi:MAG: type 1 glutamine amidotransferase domain-containing protein [Acidobacteriota bacterium]
MAARNLEGKRVAILVEKGFEQVELTSPKQAVEDAGARADVVSPVEGDTVRGWNHTDWGEEVPVDVPLDRADPADYDALLLPGGVMNPDHLRVNEAARRFVRSFFDAGKPVASICHGPWTLIDAEVVEGREMTSYHTLRKDLENAGARWVDREVVTDGNLVTSRNPNDLPAFNAKTVELFAAGVRELEPAVR